SVEDWSTESSASLTECHPRQFFFQSLPFGRVSRFCKPIHERKEALFLGFLGLKTSLDQIDEHAIGAHLPCLGQRPHTLGDTGRNRHALTNSPLHLSHVQHVTPLRTSLHHRSADHHR